MTTTTVGASQPAMGPLGRVLRGIERGIECLGKATAWLTLVLVVLVCADVALRYIWHTGSIAQQELQWHLLAVIAMISAAFTFQQGDHVRVDVLYQHYPRRLQVVFDIVVNLAIVLPAMLFLAWTCIGFVEQSWSLREGSSDPGGLPARYVIKAFLPLGFLLVALQGGARGLLDLAALLIGRGETTGEYETRVAEVDDGA